MAKLSILAGATSQSATIFIQDSSSTTGAGKTGLVFNTASLVAYYTFSGANTSSVAITLATLATVTTAYSSGGFIEIDATNMPGLYRLDIPDATLVSSKGRSVVIMLKGAANMAPLVLEIELTVVDNQSVTYGLANLDAAISSRMATYAQPTGFLAATFPTGTVANTTNITAGIITTVTNLTNAATAGDFTATMKTSLNAATPVSTLSSAYDFAKGTVAMTESYPVKGATITPVQALYELTQNVLESSISGTTKTIKKRDQATSAKTGTLDSATTPTSITEAT